MREPFLSPDSESLNKTQSAVAPLGAADSCFPGLPLARLHSGQAHCAGLDISQPKPPTKQIKIDFAAGRISRAFAEAVVASLEYPKTAYETLAESASQGSAMGLSGVRPE